jgi:hypothetical protein
MSRKRFVWLRLLAARVLVAAVAGTAVADEGKDEARGNERKVGIAK